MEKVKIIQKQRTKELEAAKTYLKGLKEKQHIAQRNVDDILKSLSKLKLHIEDNIKQNFENKKRIVDLKVLKSKIPKEISHLEKKIKGSLRLIKSTKKASKKIKTKKTKYVKKLESINYLVQKYERTVINISDSIKSLVQKEKQILEGKIVWAGKSVVSNLGDIIKKYVLKEKPVKKKTVKKKAKKKVVKNKAKKKSVKK